MALSDLEKIRQKLGHCTLDWAPSLWLNTGVPELNQVIGHKDKGIPYGRVIEISGLESHGKTAITMALAALAQRDGAQVIWGDLENSFDNDWAQTRKVRLDDSLMLIQPYVGRFGKEKTPRLSTGQELCSEIEHGIKTKVKQNRKLVILDSLPSILTEGESAAGLEGRNLRTNMELPMFLGSLLRRWVGLVQVYNATLIMINQLRQNPMQRFGSPWYSPGGNAPRFYSHVRVRVHRIKGGKILDGGKLIGIQGVMTAIKNKSGGLEGSTVGYRLFFNGPIEFVPTSEIKREEADG